MIDAKGVLNPGLMPQRLDDLHHIAPARTEVDDVLVERWNRVAEVWRIDAEVPRRRCFATPPAGPTATRPARRCGRRSSIPLIERARWHRRIRSRTEAVWDYLCGRVLHVPDAGVVLDRAMVRSVPAPLVAQLDDSLDLLVESPRLDDEGRPLRRRGRRGRPPDRHSITGSQVSLAEIAAEPSTPTRTRAVVRLADPDPLRFLQGELHELWKEALTALQSQAQARPGSQAAEPPPRPDRPVSPDRHPLDPRPRRRPDRDPGHGPTSRSSSPPPRSAPRAPPASRSWPSGSTATTAWSSSTSTSWAPSATSSGTPPEATSSISTTRPTSTTSSSPSAWKSPTSSTRSCPARSNRGDRNDLRFGGYRYRGLSTTQPARFVYSFESSLIFEWSLWFAVLGNSDVG